MINKLLSLFLIFLLSPVFLVLAIIVYFDDGLPIIFNQYRYGKGNCKFKIFKFRTMKTDTPNVATHLMKNEAQHFTKTGIFLRKYSLDELPQLFNILKGDMRFIGPRPALHNQNDLIDLRKKHGIDTLLPGVTGWAQVNGRDNISILEKIDLEKYYKKHKSIILDLKILWLTFFKVLKASDVRIS